jgi:carbon-nitrogen hydrolase
MFVFGLIEKLEGRLFDSAAVMHIGKLLAAIGTITCCPENRFSILAVANGVWVISSDVTGERDDRISYGPTAVIDPAGNVVAQVPLLETGRVVAEIELHQ